MTAAGVFGSGPGFLGNGSWCWSMVELLLPKVLVNVFAAGLGVGGAAGVTGLWWRGIVATIGGSHGHGGVTGDGLLGRVEVGCVVAVAAVRFVFAATV